MYLVKFSNKKYVKLAVSGESIHLGSFDYYRKIENEKLRDEDEGGGRVLYKSTRPLKADEFNRIFANDGYTLLEGWTIDLGSSGLYSERSPYNCFIFCCSLCDSEAEIYEMTKKFKTDGHYYIKDIWKFADGIAQVLKQINIEKAKADPNALTFQLEKIKELRFYPVLGKVFYSDDSKVKTVDEKNIGIFSPKKIDARDFFQKPTNFSEEKEFRFTWWPNLGDLDKGIVDLVSINIPFLNVTLHDNGLSAEKVSLPREHFVNKRGKPIF